MNKLISNKPATLGAALVGFIAGAMVIGIVTFLLDHKNNSATGLKADLNKERKPLYWVAPMDPNFRKDKPGKSPMGMDLIPVYEDESALGDSGPGTITIKPEVVNNLGVRTAQVERKKLTQQISTVGYVKYDENRLIHIHPRVSGWIDKLYVKATGDEIEKGEPLYSLYSPELVNAQEELLLALSRNNQRLIQAAEDRLGALRISNSFVRNLKKTRTVKQSVLFYSAQSGVVDNLNIREGFYVQPGTTLFSIGALDQVWVEAEVFERQASLVNTGEKVTMTLDYLPGTAWQGVVNYIYPTLDSETRTIRLRIQFDNPDKKLLPNMFAQVVIHSESDHQSLLIPREALIRTGRQNRVVLALGQGRFKSVEVRAGRENHHYVEILDGLEEGERVVSSAQFLLDSESSKTSDFLRMTPIKQDNLSGPESVWVEGVIDKQMVSERVVTVSHGAIDVWNMKAMTMNFSVANDVNISALSPGAVINMNVAEGDGGLFKIIDVQVISSEINDVHNREGGQ